jgi:soluble lytic murein transglycosylase-like protein
MTAHVLLRVLPTATAVVLAGSPGPASTGSSDAARAQSELEQAITNACADVASVWPVPAALVRAIIRQESNFNPRAVSSAGAIGLMQVMPFNAPRVGLTEAELSEPRKNVLAGTRLLAVLLKHYEGDLISSLAAYNAKPRKLFAPLPENGETPGYVRAVLRYYRDYGGKVVMAPPRADARAHEGRESKQDVRSGTPAQP